MTQNCSSFDKQKMHAWDLQSSFVMVVCVVTLKLMFHKDRLLARRISLCGDQNCHLVSIVAFTAETNRNRKVVEKLGC